MEQQNKENMRKEVYEKPNQKKLTRVRALKDDTVEESDIEIIDKIDEFEKNTKRKNKLDDSLEISTNEYPIKSKSKKPWIIIDFEQITSSPVGSLLLMRVSCILRNDELYHIGSN